MDRHRIGKLQFFQHLKAVGDCAIIVKQHFHSLCQKVNLLHDSHISIENTRSFVDGDSIAVPCFPLDLIVILDLHNLIAFAEPPSGSLLFIFLRRWRVEISLKHLVQVLHSQASFSHRCQYLNIRRSCIHISGHLLLHKSKHNA